MDKILVTPRSITREGNHPSLEKLNESGHEIIFCTPGVQPGEDELIGLLEGCCGYLAGVEKISARVIESANTLRVISRNGVGTDNIDIQAAERKNIKICITPGANTRGVTELTIALLLSMARSVPYCSSEMKQGRWSRKKGFELEGRTLGLFGYGRIGSKVALLAQAAGMKILVHDPYIRDKPEESDGLRFVQQDELLKASDVISFHCPMPEEGKPVFHSGTLNLVKKGVCIINTARAELIDEAAALEGLNQGIIRGLALDVFRSEPPGLTELIKHENVITTPHAGGFTAESVDRAMHAAVDNLIANL